MIGFHFRDAMQSKLRTRRQMNERKKVSKKPNMPMIMAEVSTDENVVCCVGRVEIQIEI